MQPCDPAWRTSYPGARRIAWEGYKGEATMRIARNILKGINIATIFVTVLLSASLQARSQEAAAHYLKMAPIDQYLIADRNAEIVMARSAAPPSISTDAEIMVLGPKGYETAVKGKNGFVCVVHRSWTSEANDPEFWNPKRRGPMCLNAQAARSYLPNTIMRTNLVFAGRSEAQMFDALKAAFENKELPALEPGAMCYMLSRQ